MFSSAKSHLQGAPEERNMSFVLGGAMKNVYTVIM